MCKSGQANYGVLTAEAENTTRKPWLGRGQSGESLNRLAERASQEESNQDPPRNTRFVEPLVTLGSEVVPERLPYADPSYMSSHHSLTLPCMSYRPKSFFAYAPTVVVR